MMGGRGTHAQNGVVSDVSQSRSDLFWSWVNYDRFFVRSVLVLRC